jgi:hypothetical protein
MGAVVTVASAARAMTKPKGTGRDSSSRGRGSGRTSSYCGDTMRSCRNSDRENSRLDSGGSDCWHRHPPPQQQR